MVPRYYMYCFKTAWQTYLLCVSLRLTGHLEPIDQALRPEDAWVHTSPGDRWGGSGKRPVAAVPVPPRHNSIRQRILRSRYRRTSNMIANCSVSVTRWAGRDRRGALSGLHRAHLVVSRLLRVSMRWNRRR